MAQNVHHAATPGVVKSVTSLQVSGGRLAGAVTEIFNSGHASFTKFNKPLTHFLDFNVFF